MASIAMNRFSYNFVPLCIIIIDLNVLVLPCRENIQEFFLQKNIYKPLPVVTMFILYTKAVLYFRI